MLQHNLPWLTGSDLIITFHLTHFVLTLNDLEMSFTLDPKLICHLLCPAPLVLIPTDLWTPWLIWWCFQFLSLTASHSVQSKPKSCFPILDFFFVLLPFYQHRIYIYKYIYLQILREFFSHWDHKVEGVTLHDTILIWPNAATGQRGFHCGWLVDVKLPTEYSQFHVPLDSCKPRLDLCSDICICACVSLFDTWEVPAFAASFLLNLDNLKNHKHVPWIWKQVANHYQSLIDAMRCCRLWELYMKLFMKSSFCHLVLQHSSTIFSCALLAGNRWLLFK